MTEQHLSLLERLAAEAIRLGAEQLEMAYEDGHYELSAVAGDFGSDTGGSGRSGAALAPLLRDR
jgi:hypothetical protein